MNWRRAMLILGASIVIVVIVGVTLFGIEGVRHKRLVEACKTLQIGMTEKQIIDVLGEPATRATHRRGNVVIERLAFKKWGIMPDVTAQGIVLEINAATGLAARIICDEKFHVRDAQMEELDRRGIY